MSDKAREIHEQGYIEGTKAIYRHLLREAIHNLGANSPEFTAQSWQIERADAIAMLRQVCGEYGDNGWSDDLYLADIIEKHLWRHLE